MYVLRLLYRSMSSLLGFDEASVSVVVINAFAGAAVTVTALELTLWGCIYNAGLV